MARQPTAARKSGPTPRQILMYFGIAIAAVALVYAAFGLESDDGPTIEEVAGSPDIDGETLPAVAPEDEDIAVGGAAPVVTGADFDGNPATIGDREAELLVFMAAWCPACQAELPELVEWLDGGGLPDGVDLTVVSTGLDPTRPPWPPQGWLERGGYTGEILVDDAEGSVAQAFGLTGTPFWVVLQDGELVMRASGQLGMDQVEQIARSIAP
ncbi:TlpA family protein disulfide reductase [Nitriliruptor alkaliphilus]|uniref:TlpA family protein disulfide reductase n=1 Tax=Nitriliruptor alkaliphilus TaxID=427918 RepID=UPI000696AD32|nr:TlpA disulfide reductase family protein [Nitriliruptor alkaliphilus]